MLAARNAASCWLIAYSAVIRAWRGLPKKIKTPPFHFSRVSVASPLFRLRGGTLSRATRRHLARMVHRDRFCERKKIYDSARQQCSDYRVMSITAMITLSNSNSNLSIGVNKIKSFRWIRENFAWLFSELLLSDERRESDSCAEYLNLVALAVLSLEMRRKTDLVSFRGV